MHCHGSSPLASSNRKQLWTSPQKIDLPAVYPREDYVEGSGGLMSYGPQRAEPYGRLALMVDKILKGSKPADFRSSNRLNFSL